MKKVFHAANKRGHNDLGWLKANFSFSFGSYYDPDKVHFGALRVLNDDIIGKGMGFGMHPHDNMEIVTIVLNGALKHKDSMGNDGIIQKGEVQVMSSGRGIMHSEFNPLHDVDTSSLQIWVFPNEKDVTPRYDQQSFTDVQKLNELTTIISPDKNGHALWINQDATFSIGEFDAGQKFQYLINTPGNGVYIFLLEGSVIIDGATLNKRDALGVYDTSSVTIETTAQSHVLIIEVPM
ncbi:pirin family protein [Mucilaginibacter hurinus]|uniref:Pirin family protein n=1 Tax=Mucilaginibacter hurinus TaxID=2201324 RepID=A0A367GNV1_9SPHI|nr:pirin family protein [Mucilaginibacter hurinus]RCH54715.1 pirin family protein [Mucilaginibacter hurinus]